MFIGQVKIKRELHALMSEIKRGENYNILLVAPSGFGKTTLAYRMLSSVPYDQCDISGPPDFEFNQNVRFHLLDEIHELSSPEVLYPYMDSRLYTIILASNETGALKEPLVNRCIPLIFERYSNIEMKGIIYSNLPSIKEEFAVELVKYSKHNPRVATMLCRRLEYVFDSTGMPNTIDELRQVMYDILNISEDGFGPLERRYVDYLRSVGGSASLSLVTNGTRIDQRTIERDIEPLLVLQGILRIGHKGRSLINEFHTE